MPVFSPSVNMFLLTVLLLLSCLPDSDVFLYGAVGILNEPTAITLERRAGSCLALLSKVMAVYSILSCSCLVRQKGNSRFALPDTTAFLFFLYMQVDVNAYLQGLGVLLVSACCTLVVEGVVLRVGQVLSPQPECQMLHLESSCRAESGIE